MIVQDKPGRESAGLCRYIPSDRFPWWLRAKESTCIAGDGLPSVGQEHPLEMGMATHSSILAWEIPWTRSLLGYSPWGLKESDMTQ